MTDGLSGDSGKPVFYALDVYFAALMAATKFHLDGPKAPPLDFARSQRPLDPDLPDFVPARQSSASDALRPRGKP